MSGRAIPTPIPVPTTPLHSPRAPPQPEAIIPTALSDPLPFPSSDFPTHPHPLGSLKPMRSCLTFYSGSHLLRIDRNKTEPRRLDLEAATDTDNIPTRFRHYFDTISTLNIDQGQSHDTFRPHNYFSHSVYKVYGQGSPTNTKKTMGRRPFQEQLAPGRSS